jgi:hypothetical protein
VFVWTIADFPVFYWVYLVYLVYLVYFGVPVLVRAMVGITTANPTLRIDPALQNVLRTVTQR